MGLFIHSLHLYFTRKSDLLAVLVAAIMVGICIFLSRHQERADDKTTRRFLLICLVWWAFVVAGVRPHGFNYDIYTYNASLQLAGHQTFGRVDATPYTLNAYRNATYLDYSGAQHLAYVALTWINEHAGRHLAGLGFRLWTLGWSAACVGLIYWRRQTVSRSLLAAVIIPAAFFSFEPMFTSSLYRYDWEDKLPFFAFPLLTLALAERGKINYASAVVGFASLFNGCLILFSPIWAVYLLRTYGRRAWPPIAIMVIAALVTMVPFFPESLSAWHYRSVRMALPHPFWFSVYLPITKFYFSRLNSIVMIGACLALMIGVWRGKVTLTEALLGSLAALMLLDNYNGAYRVAPVLMLLVACSPEMKVADIFRLGVLTLVCYAAVQSGYNPSNINDLHDLVFYVPVIYAVYLYISLRSKRSGHDHDDSSQSVPMPNAVSLR